MVEQLTRASGSRGWVGAWQCYPRMNGHGTEAAAWFILDRNVYLWQYNCIGLRHDGDFLVPTASKKLTLLRSNGVS